METLKTALVIVVLGGVGYAVYVSLNKNPTSEPPPEAPKAWQAPVVQQPGTSAPIGQNPASAKARPDLTAKSGNAATHLYPQPPTASIAANAPATSVGASNDSPSGGVTATTGVDPRDAMAAVTPGDSTPRGQDAGPSGFAAAWKIAHAQLNDGQLAEAQLSLSLWYDDPRTSEAEARQLNDLLDQLAGTVIYSTQHLLEPPYVVRPGDQMQSIADEYHVPWQLLAKINGIDDPSRLQPGDRLKVLRGPFSAVVSLQKQELTLMLNGRYAGRFPIGIGRDTPLQEGHYTVKNKELKPRYYGAGGQVLEPDDPANPLGERWIGLGGQLGIHGTNDPRSIGRNDLRGCISLSPKDVEDVYDILCENSKVVIRR